MSTRRRPIFVIIGISLDRNRCPGIEVEIDYVGIVRIDTKVVGIGLVDLCTEIVPAEACDIIASKIHHGGVHRHVGIACFLIFEKEQNFENRDAHAPLEHLTRNLLIVFDEGCENFRGQGQNSMKSSQLFKSLLFAPWRAAVVLAQRRYFCLAISTNNSFTLADCLTLTQRRTSLSGGISAWPSLLITHSLSPFDAAPPIIYSGNPWAL